MLFYNANLKRISNEIVNDINIMLCSIKVNSNTVELTVQTFCYCVLDSLCVKINNYLI